MKIDTSKQRDPKVIKLMSYRAAVFSGMIADKPGGKYEDLPEPIKAFFALLRYKEIVRCLVCKDRKRGDSIQRISITYNLTWQETWGILKNFYCENQ